MKTTLALLALATCLLFAYHAKHEQDTRETDPCARVVQFMVYPDDLKPGEYNSDEQIAAWRGLWHSRLKRAYKAGQINDDDYLCGLSEIDTAVSALCVQNIRQALIQESLKARDKD